MSKATQDPSPLLNNELSSYRQQSAARRPEFAAAYDALVKHLTALDADEIGPKIGERMPPFLLSDEAATVDRGSASGIYLASYFLGGLGGSFVLGQLFDSLGWLACVIGIAAALALAAVLGSQLKLSFEPRG